MGNKENDLDFRCANGRWSPKQPFCWRFDGPVCLFHSCPCHSELRPPQSEHSVLICQMDGYSFENPPSVEYCCGALLLPLVLYVRAPVSCFHRIPGLETMGEESSMHVHIHIYVDTCIFVIIYMPWLIPSTCDSHSSRELWLPA